MSFEKGGLFYVFCLAVASVLCNPSCPETKPGMINVHIVCHTHDDVGWLKTVDEYFYGYRQDITWIGVQYIFESVIPALVKDPTRKFIYVESAFFYRWWNQQDDRMKNIVQGLVDGGQLEFIGGGWCMNDEGASHYNGIIDQMTVGLAKLSQTFGKNGIPRIAWQIDPFGHSNEQASLFAQMGFDALFIGRLDHADKDNRKANMEMEMVWKASNSLGEAAWIFTGVLPNKYSPPSGFCFDLQCRDDPVMDDPTLEGYNKNEKIDSFLQAVQDQQTYYATSNLIMTMGDDFHYMSAETWYLNLDKVIKYVNERQVNGSMVNVMYSTPSCYLDALHAENMTWPTKEDDFFPYSSSSNQYWTGYFSSRPTFKGFIRKSNNILQGSKQIAALADLKRDSIEELAEAVAVVQHHDAVTGTAKQHVTDDYSKLLSKALDSTLQSISEGLQNLTGFSTAEFVTCPLLNISSCSFTEEQSTFVLSVYNPIGRFVNHFIRLPIQADVGYSVTDHLGLEVESQIVPLPVPVMNIPGRVSNAQFELVFQAQDLPPLGIKQYNVAVTGKTPVKEQLSKKLGPQINEKDIVVRGDKVTLTFDGESQTLKYFGLRSESEERQIQMSQNFLWYEGFPGGNGKQASGAYAFRPTGPANSFSVVQNISVYEGPLVSVVHQEFSPYITQVLRLYKNVTYADMEWLVGPIPVDDGIGKEIVNRIVWPTMTTDGVFFTDSNGREMQERVIDYRSTWTLQSTEPISQNYYPVTSKMIVASTNGEGNAALLNDRAQGGTSLADGEMELMVHRRLLYDDGFGVGEPLDEKAYGDGLVAIGHHFVVHSSADTPECDFGCQHRNLGEQLLLQPIFFFSPSSSDSLVQTFGLSTPLPDNVHLLTLEPWDWNANQWLLRLENFYELNESSNSGTASVDIENMFTSWTVTDIVEMTLGANQLKSENIRLQWNSLSSEDADHSNAAISSAKGPLFALAPMEIRTFIITVAPV